MTDGSEAVAGPSEEPATLSGDVTGIRAEPIDESGEQTVRVSRTADPEDGSTVIARRESRRRQERAQIARDSADDPPALDATVVVHKSSPGGTADVTAPPGRVAHAPEASGATSPVRSPAPVIATRATRVRHEPQEVIDTASQDEARRRRGRRTMLISGAAASVAIVVIVVALIALLAMG